MKYGIMYKNNMEGIKCFTTEASLHINSDAGSVR